MECSGRNVFTERDKDAVELRTYSPYINTTPDEAVPFLMLKKGTPLFFKFIMENFVSFFAYDILDDESDGCAIRFEHFLDWETFKDFESIHIPMEIIKETKNIRGYLRDILKKEYILLVPYNKKYIDFFKCAEDNEHKLILTGYETKRGFRCWDYKSNKLMDFLVKPDQLEKAIRDYPWERRLKTGIFGLKDKGITTISCFPLWLQLRTLTQDRLITCDDGVQAFGCEAIELMLHAVTHYSENQEKLKRYFEIINFLKEYMKLWNVRIEWMNLHMIQIADLYKRSCDIQKILEHAFLVAAKSLARKVYTEEKCERLHNLLSDIKDQLMEFFKEALVRIEQFQKKPYENFDSEVSCLWGKKCEDYHMFE